MNERGIVVVGGHWNDRRSELSFVTRSIAGAASRCGLVSVLVPGAFEPPQPDGAFDLAGLGEAGRLRWPDGLPSDSVVIVDELTPELSALLSRVSPNAVLYLTSSADVSDPAWRRLHPVRTEDRGPFCPIDVYVPVNPLAELHRHHGFGFTDYTLVLSDRSGPHEAPPPPVAWLSAAFHGAYVIVVEDAVASAWKGRVLRGAASVDSRMDLSRLLAHANVCVDLAPGRHIARECIEALRFGTPIIAPEGSGPGAAHALASGGAVFGDEGELLHAAAAFENAAHRSQASAHGRSYADTRYGDPGALVTRLHSLLAES